MGLLNLQNSSKATSEARYIMEKRGLDILAVQEPYSVAGKVRGFGLSTTNMVVGNRSDEQRPMAAIACNSRLEPLELAQYNTTHCCVIRLNTAKGPMNLISAYFQFCEEIEPHLNHLARILRGLEGQMTIIAADVNAHSVNWYCQTEDEKGELMSEFIHRFGLIIINREGQPSTHVSGQNIDLTLATPNIARYLTDWNVHIDDSISDHRLITWSVSLTLLKDLQTTDRLNFKKANFEEINNDILHPTYRITSNLDLDRTNNKENVKNKMEYSMRQWEDCATRACNKHVPKIKIRTKCVPWWNNQLTAQRTKMNRACRSYQHCCECRVKLVKLGNFRIEKRRYASMIKQAKQESWQSFVRDSINEDPFSLAYKLGANKIKLKDVLTTLKKEGEERTESIEETLSLLLEKLVPRDSLEDEQAFHANIRESCCNYRNTNIEPRFSVTELREALDKCKVNRAMGLDNLPAEFLKNLSDVNLELLLVLINGCWCNGIFPKIWKRARLKIIRKAGERDWSNPSSFRPISLLPVAGKVYERLLTRRLTGHIEANDLLSETQYGFVKGKGTVEAIARLKDYVSQSLCKYVIAVFFDIKGAFDAVWWPGILSTLKELNVSRTIFDVLASYLSERTVSIAHDGVTIHQVMDKGCPQGSVLGPLLWNITFDSLLKSNFPEGVNVIAFADDVVFVIEGNTRRHIEEMGDRVCSILQEWAARAKMAISVEKTKGLLLKGKLSGRSPLIRYQGRRISFVDNVKYLGVTLERNLTFVAHAKAVKIKAKALFGKLSRLIRLKYGVKMKQLNFLYKTVFVPIMSYASKCWRDRVDHSIVAGHLRDAQRHILICLTGAYRTTSLLALCTVTNNMPLGLKIKQDLDVRRAKRRLIEDSQRDVLDRFHGIWQEMWDLAETGRFTYQLLPSVEERQDLKHLNQIDHVGVQLLTGHGAFGTYLYKLNKRDNDLCDDCGDQDHPLHALMECPAHEDLREDLHQLRIERPWSFATLLREEEGFCKMMKIWAEINCRRDL